MNATAQGAEARRPGPAARCALCLIRGYQLFLSPWLGARCRFLPTCSEYAAESIRRFGFVRGLGLGLRRIMRCHPFCSGGYDPVPERDAAPPPGPHSH
ncbi:MAG: membrane protein insertion efficiency factor YidD [Gammaproteobacteria bacterium]|nr:MAG: membrane protein insertion efficiency factor YidD [Gammaproteobacteria bacterium]